VDNKATIIVVLLKIAPDVYLASTSHQPTDKDHSIGGCFHKARVIYCMLTYYFHQHQTVHVIHGFSTFVAHR
jgi:hypothetical protein